MAVILDVLPAKYGDSLVVSYGSDKQMNRLIIDGGPAPTYADGLRAYIAGLAPAERRFELAVVSHVDADHIDGGLMLLQDDALGVQLGDVWFNGWPQISGEKIDPSEAPERGALQGAFLTDLLQKRAWNTTYSGGPVVRDLDQRVQLPGGAELLVLSPTPLELGRLRDEWTATVKKAGFDPGDNAGVAKRLHDGGRYEPPAEAPGEDDRGAASKIGSDRAIANGSSIALLFQYDDKRILLGADAHAGVLTDALRALTTRNGTEKVNLDLFKLAHHGSAGNVSPDLLSLVHCSRYVVSTNGDHFHHPDPETIELLGNQDSPPTVYFNYQSDTTSHWVEEAAQSKAGIKAVYGDGHLRIEL